MDRRRVARVVGAVMAFVAAVAGGVSAASAPMSVARPDLKAVQRPADILSVMSYNVHGLPWPIAFRGTAYAQMAQRLRDLRAAGQQPHVVVLQEAFTADAKAIGAAAGYRYIRFGPAADVPPVATGNGDDRFAADASHLRGEDDGKWADSGLAILSDYPIVASRQMAYPVCAGFDCLANKGALAVQIAVPGVAEPIFVVGTHLNARKAAGVDRDRANAAFASQIALLDAFVRAVVPHDAPLFVAGDFNVGRSPERNAVAAQVSSGTLAQPAFAQCARLARCSIVDAADARAAVHRNKDWLLFRPGAALAVAPVEFRALFGREADGSQLSDHVGIAAAYRLRASLRGV